MPKAPATPFRVQDAVQSAHAYLKMLVPEAKGTRLEEVELSEGRRKEWVVTLSYLDPDPGIGMVLRGIQAPPRLYKEFRIADETGQVRSMKIRQLAAA